jgi:putative membrane protein
MYPSRRVSTAILLLVILATWIQPAWPIEQAMHGSLTVVGLALLWRYARKYPLSDRDYFLIVIFLCVHSVAARWLYSYVPYDQWLRSITGLSLNDSLGWTRNNFDRLVHFLFGLCFTPAIVSHAMQRHKRSARSAFYVTLAIVMIASLWYEWFELAVAMTLSGEDAESYNGQQGDMWDAHKDMLMATLGSLAWSRFYLSKKFVSR